MDGRRRSLEQDSKKQSGGIIQLLEKNKNRFFCHNSRYKHALYMLNKLVFTMHI